MEKCLASGFINNESEGYEQKKRAKEMNQIKDALFSKLIWGSIVVLCLSLLMIILFVGKTGMHVFTAVTFQDFFLSFDWVPEEDHFGAGLFIVGTLYLTGLSLILSIPVALVLATFNAVIAPTWVSAVTRPVLDVLVGIPSVVYGYLGLTVLIPWIRTLTGELMGDGILVAAMVLAFMVLPTITRISDDSISSLPVQYAEAAYALGATRAQVIWTVLVPAAKNGIITGIVLGMARAIGETMAVVMVIGNVAQLPGTLFTPTAVLTSNIVSQIMNVQFDSTWNDALYMMAFILLFISLMLICLVNGLRRKEVN